MRYPVGFRPTVEDAVQAASEAARMTGLRYRVERVDDAAPEHGVYVAWEFAPVKRPEGDGEYHMAIRV